MKRVHQAVDSFERLYKAAATGDTMACTLLQTQQFYYAMAAGPADLIEGSPLPFSPQQAHDPRTADTQPVSLENVLAALVSAPSERRQLSEGFDRFTFIMHYVSEVLPALLASPREHIVREEQMQPVYRVKQLTPNSMLYINRQAGETPHQKLNACRSGIPATVRRFSLDSSENRILKSFAIRALELYDYREQAFGEARLSEEENALAATLARWLKEDAVQEISLRGIESPNNVILGNARYNRIWRGLSTLRSLDEALQQDCCHLAATRTNHAAWQLATELYRRGAQFPQQAVIFDDSTLQAWPGSMGNGEFLGKLNGKEFRLTWTLGQLELFWNRKQFKWETESFSPAAFNGTFPPPWKELSCTPNHRDGTGHTVVDFCAASPWVATGTAPHPLPFIPRMQFMQAEDASGQSTPFTLDLSSMGGVYLAKEAPTLSAADLLNDDVDAEQRRILAEVLAERLRRHFGERDFTYLLPDDVDDFSATLLRSTLRLGFLQSAPRSLPRCVAAAIGHATRNEVQPNSLVIVATYTHNHIILSPLAAHPQKRAFSSASPGGLRWVRHPFSILERQYSLKDEREGLLFFEDAQAGFSRLAPPPPLSPQELAALKEEAQRRADKHSFTLLISPEADTLMAGARACAAFDAQPNLPPEAALWKDHLPPLSVMVPNEHLADSPFTLVSSQTTISPRLRNVTININGTFVLPAGQKEYHFPLIMGEHGNRSRYSMRLRSRHFPLEQDLNCKLELLYSYGEPQPYSLHFSGDGLYLEAEWCRYRATQGLGEIPPAPQPESLRELENRLKHPNQPLSLVERSTQWLQSLSLCGSQKEGALHCGFISRMDAENDRLCYIADSIGGKEYRCGRMPWFKEGQSVFFSLRTALSVSLVSPQRGTVKFHNWKHDNYAINTHYKGKHEVQFTTSDDSFVPSLNEGDEVNLFYVQGKGMYARHATDKLPQHIPGIAYALVESVDAEGNAIIINEQNGERLKAYNNGKFSLYPNKRIWYWKHQRKVNYIPKIINMATKAAKVGDIVAASDSLPQNFRVAAAAATNTIEKLLGGNGELRDEHKHRLASISLTVSGKRSPRAMTQMQKLIQEFDRLHRKGLEEGVTLRDSLRMYSDGVGLAKESWQMDIAHAIIRQHFGFAETTRTWKKLLWKVPELVMTLSPQTVRDTLSYLEKHIGREGSHFQAGNNRRKPQQANPILIYSTEIMLALLRLRGSTDSSLQAAFSLDGELTARCRRLLSEIITRFVVAGVYDTVHSSLRMDNLPVNGNYPPLIYALRQYLTGENPMGSIRIVSSDDENDEEEVEWLSSRFVEGQSR